MGTDTGPAELKALPDRTRWRGVKPARRSLRSRRCILHWSGAYRAISVIHRIVIDQQQVPPVYGLMAITSSCDGDGAAAIFERRGFVIH
ncbi:hypothetical protein KCP76_02595 [Salmonella enterica subsp. enterica serovar Weltevreden]|nr:hypothetical protein KCP76_02595 [Salmonella enterica subsp. enterica serovar Weltevreden]